MPKVVDEYLRWVAVSNGIGLVVATTVLIAFIVLFIRLLKTLEEDERPLLAVFVIPFMFLPAGIGGFAHKLIKVTVAPRIVILEKIADIVE